MGPAVGDQGDGEAALDDAQTAWRDRQVDGELGGPVGEEQRPPGHTRADGGRREGKGQGVPQPVGRREGEPHRPRVAGGRDGRQPPPPGLDELVGVVLGTVDDALEQSDDPGGDAERPAVPAEQVVKADEDHDAGPGDEQHVEGDVLVAGDQHPEGGHRGERRGRAHRRGEQGPNGQHFVGPPAPELP